MSVINRMLSDLDKKEPQEQIKEEVAFLDVKPEPKKPQRSKKWWAALISSGVSGLLAVVVGYMYYSQSMQTVDVLERMQVGPKPPVDQNLAAKASQQTTQDSQQNVSQGLSQNKEQNKEKNETQSLDISDSAAEKTNETESQSGVVANAQSAPSAIANKADAPPNQPKLVVLNNTDENGQPIARKSTLSVQQQTPVSFQSQNQSESQTPEQLTAQAIAQQSATLSASPSQSTQLSTQAAAQNQQANGSDDGGQMTISKVSMSNEQRAQKHANQGQKLAQQGMIQPAIEKYQQALGVYPAHQQGRLALAGLYYGRNMVAEALEVLSQGLNIEPGNQNWSLLAAKIHYSRDNFAAALAYLQLPVHPVDNIEYVALRATTLQKLKDYQAAAETFERLTVIYPESARWWLGLATSLEGSSKYAQAVDAYRQTLRLGSISQTSRRFVLGRLAQLER